MNNKELHALVTLLEDDDHEVTNHVENQIRSFGTAIIPLLEDEWENTFNPIIQEKIEDIIHFLQFELVQERITDWKENHQDDLLMGIWIIASYQYPDLELTSLRQEIEQIYQEVWRNFKDKLQPFDQVRILNSVIFDQMKFRSNTKNFHSPANSMINSVLESKKGNPISLCSIYMLIAQRLELPVYGVNLPNLFILTYKTEETQFYINVFNKGLIFSKEDIDSYIEHLQIQPLDIYYQPCGHLEILIRYLRNLIVAFEKVDEFHKSDEIKIILNHLEPNQGLL
jgi:regulator of sirC expression with transglutaminase-like and TPR domain